MISITQKKKKTHQFPKIEVIFKARIFTFNRSFPEKMAYFVSSLNKISMFQTYAGK